MKINYFILLFFALTLGFTSCNDDDEDLMGDWWELSGLDGVSRSDAVGFVIDSKFYIGTGYDGDDRLTDFWEYNPSQDYWTQKTSFPGAARNGAIGMAIDGKGYIGTGFDGDNALNDFYEYDPSANEWTKKADFIGNARYGSCSFAIGDYGYVGMGKDDDNLLYKDFYVYSPENDSWSSIVSPGASKRFNAQTFVIDGTAYVFSGYASGYENDMWAYNPTTGLWTEMRKISNATDYKYDNDYTSISRMDGVTFTINGKGYLATGSTGSLVSNVWEYDPQSDLWEEKTEFAEGDGNPRTEAVGFAVGSKGYIVTGRSGSSYYYDLWCFDPTAEADDTNN